ncbi:MAG: lysylphosphatidylglycerol synthase domain-containing protein [Halofilum sp. (in: g-proteobacteria)]|nr:lysylphosphatidylglycerol synthase domain-containing protein [Halofilum sp. (in: g-proteobacteria)]
MTTDGPGFGRGEGRSWLRPGLSLAIAVAFIAFVEWYAGWRSLLQPWLRAVRTGALLVATVLMLLTHAARAMRVHDYFGAPVQGRRGACLRLVLQHNLFNNLLPMRSGELAFPVLMARRFGIRPGVSVPGLLWFRLLDLHTLLLLAAPVLAPLLPMPAGLLVIGMAAWLLVPWLGWRGSHRLLERSESPRAVASAGCAGRARAGRPAAEAIRVFWRSQAWTLVNWALKLAVFVWLLLQFAPLAASARAAGRPRRRTDQRAAHPRRRRLRHLRGRRCGRQLGERARCGYVVARGRQSAPVHSRGDPGGGRVGLRAEATGRQTTNDGESS